MPSIADLERLLELAPEDAFIYYGLAQEYFKLGQNDEAIAQYDKCLERDSNYIYAYYHKAKAQDAAGDLGGAKISLESGMKSAQAIDDSHAYGELCEYLADIESR